MESILTEIKKLLGIKEEYEEFDLDIIVSINTAFMTLTQIGIGPTQGFFISDKETKWNDFTEGRTDIAAIKSFIYLSVRLLFDPPQASFVLSAMQDTLKELTWRLNVQSDVIKEGILNAEC